MASAAEQLAANIESRRLLQGDRAQEAHLVHPRRADRLPARHLHPGAGHRCRGDGRSCCSSTAAASSACSTCSSGGALGRMTIFALNIMPYICASIIIQLMSVGDPAARDAEEGGRVRAQEAQPVHPLPHGADRAVPGLRHLGRARGDARRGGVPAVIDPGHVLPPLLRGHAGRRHHVPDVAGRADHRARRRQRHLADHLRRHRRQPAARARDPAGARPHRRAVAGLHPAVPGDRGRR